MPPQRLRQRPVIHQFVQALAAARLIEQPIPSCETVAVRADQPYPVP